MSDPILWLGPLAGFLTFPVIKKVLSLAKKPNPTRIVALPNPGYEPGDKQPAPFEKDGFQQVDPAQLGAAIYPFIISSVTPRPIAFISTVSKDGVGNLSPYSYFNVMSHDPPVLVTGHARRPADVPKDSLQNILDTGEFVVCIISEWFLEAANHTCGEYDKGCNEMELAGLTPEPSYKVKPPRVKESAIHFECKLVHTYDVKNKSGAITGTIVLGECVMAHMHQGLATTSPHGKPIADIFKLKPMARLGGDMYSCLRDIVEIPRPAKEMQFKTKTVAGKATPKTE